MQGSDWAIVFATLLGPVLAVQAQKWVESLREYRNRQMWVFSTLMATRAAQLHPDHVRALNMIEMAFYGRRPFGLFRWQTKAERAVVDAWYEYLDDLGLAADQIDVARRMNLFVTLLATMASAVGLRFDRMQITKSVYFPIAHGEQEREQNAIRRLLIGVLSGETPLKMDVTSLPVIQEALDAQLELHRKAASALSDGALKVEVKAQ